MGLPSQTCELPHLNGDTYGHGCRVEYTWNTDLLVLFNAVAHRLIQVGLVSLHTRFASGNQVNHSKGKRLLMKNKNISLEYTP